MTDEDRPYELYYWPPLPGRGEFVRLMLEDAAAPYLDVARLPEGDDGGMGRMQAFLRGDEPGALPFAPPFLKVGDLVISQTPTICQWLAPRLGLIGEDEASRIAAHQHHLTWADFVDEIHDTHHPMGVSLYYEDQKDEAWRRAKLFREHRMPKFLAYFERVLERNGASSGASLVGPAISYVDLVAFQVLEGLEYAFPHAYRRLMPSCPKLAAVRDAVRVRPSLADYLLSDRRVPFNETGIFRAYPELDPA